LLMISLNKFFLIAPNPGESPGKEFFNNQKLCKMTTSNQITVSKYESQSWVNVEFNSKNIQLNILNAENLTEEKIKDTVGMAFSICSNFEEIEKHCKLNGVFIQLDEIFN